MNSLQLLKSSATINDDDKISLLDPEQYSEEFKAKVYGLLTKGNLGGEDRNRESLTDCEARGVREDLLPDLKTLKADEKEYLIHSTCVHLQLAHQRNQFLHWFYVPAMAALGGRSCEESLSEGRFFMAL